MTAASSHRSDVLCIDTAVIDGRASTVIRINGEDLLQLQRPRHRPDGSLYPSGPMVFLPTDPVDLLPPDSPALLPTEDPHPAMVGICSCGHPQDASLWMQVRRERDAVIWQPDPTTLRSSIDTTWRFDLVPYLDAVDAGARSVSRWEGRPRSLARELRRRRDGLFGLDVGWTPDSRARVTGVSAAPGSDEVVVHLARIDGLHWVRLPVPDDRDDEEIIADLERLGTEAVTEYGGGAPVGGHRRGRPTRSG